MTRDTAKAAGWAYLNLAVLWTFAVAQPLFDLLKDNPEFFAARGSSGFDIVSFSVLLVVLPPAILLAIELLLGLIRPEVRQGAHIAFLGALAALIAAQALKKSIDASDTVLIVLSLAVGAALAVLWARAEPVRSFLNVLSPVPLVFLLLFLLSGQISELAFPNEAKARTNNQRQITVPRTHTAGASGTRKGRGRSGLVRRRTSTPAHTVANAAKVPNATRSPSTPMGRSPASTQATTPTNRVLRCGVRCR